MQKVTAFSKTKFCSSGDIVIISLLHFIRKQLKLKLVSFLCLLSGRGLPAPEATTLFFVFSDVVVCGQGEQHSPHWPLKRSPSWGKRIRLHETESFFWVPGCWLGRPLKQLREKVATTLLTNCRHDL